MVPYSIYIHIPFCRHRCEYCDFNTYAGLEQLKEKYVQAVCREIQLVSAAAGERLPVHTIFFGGGTPSLLSPRELGCLMEALGGCFSFSTSMEITMEGNPGTVSLETLEEYRMGGVNRLSLGVQSSHAAELRLLGRQHDYLDVIQAFFWARRVGFDNINLDLIYGLPSQPIPSWLVTLHRALELRPEHFSLYALTLEHNTPMQKWITRGLIEDTNSDLAADMYDSAALLLADAGYVQYEISNWAWRKVNGELMTCRHNLQYWRNHPYLGFGAGAHGCAGGLRIANIASPLAYIQRITEAQPGNETTFPKSPATVQADPINFQVEMSETMILGLRLVQEGISASAFQQRFQMSMQQVYGKQIEKLTGLGLLEWGGEGQDQLRLTEPARLIGNQVFLEFI